MANVWNAVNQSQYYYNTKKDTGRYYRLIMQGRPFIVFDIETTGLNKKVDYIVEFSAVVMEKMGRVYQESERAEWYIKPPFLIDGKAAEVNHITNEFLADKPDEHEVYPKIEALFMRHPDAVICGYNVSFDIGFMRELIPRNHGNIPLEMFDAENVVDVFSVVKENIYADELKDRKLSTVSEYLLPGKDFKYHDSSADIIATWEVGAELLKRFQASGAKPEGAKQKCRVLSYSQVQYGKVGHLFVTVAAGGHFYNLDYNTYTKTWAEKTTDEVAVFDLIDMGDLEDQLNKIAEEKGKKNFALLKGKEDLRR